MKVYLLYILFLTTIAAVACTADSNQVEREYLVTKVDLDSLEKAVKESNSSSKKTEIHIYSDYNFLLLDSVEAPIFFKITEWFGGDGVIIDKDYLNNEYLEFRKVKDLHYFIDSLSMAHKAYYSDSEKPVRITILTDVDKIKRDDFFTLHDLSISNNIKLIVRELYDFERQNLQERQIKRNGNQQNKQVIGH